MQPQHLASALFATLWLTGGLTAGEKPLPDRIAENIQNLSHARFSVREAATRELWDIGEPALIALKAAAKSTDEEVRKRAEALVRSLEAHIQNDALLRATKLHLKYQAKPLDEAIADLAQKTGILYVLDPKSTKNPKKELTLDTGNVPYWEAIEKFLAVAGLVEAYQNPSPGSVQPQMNNPWGGRRVIARCYGGTVSPQKPQVFLVDCSTPLASATNALIRVKVLPKDAPGFGVTKGSNEITFVLDVTPAPTLSWQGTVNVDIRRALDDRGENLAQSHVRSNQIGTIHDGTASTIQIQNFNGGQIVIQGNGQVIVNGGITWGDPVQPYVAGNWRHYPVSLLGKQSSSKMLKQLDGVITAQVLTQPQTLLTVENILTASTKNTVENGECRLELLERKSDKGGYVTLKFRLVAPAVSYNSNWQPQAALGLAEGGYSEPRQPAIIFHDASGKTINNLSVNLMEQTFDGYLQISDYQAIVPVRDQREIKLLVTGRKSVSVNVPFVLKDVPLP